MGVRQQHPCYGPDGHGSWVAMAPSSCGDLIIFVWGGDQEAASEAWSLQQRAAEDDKRNNDSKHNFSLR